MKKRPLAEKLWSKVDIRGPDECWEWTGKQRHEFGYGQMSHGRGVNLKAHRVSWQLANGPIPDGMVVCHKCDNPPCCNPNHLFLGTKKDNTHDMMAKGRMKKPPTRYGEAHHAVTIPDSELPIIRNSRKKLREIAAEYGVSIKTIFRIRTGRSRSHENQQSRT